LIVTPLDELRAAVEAAAGDLRDGGTAGGTRPTLERPKKAGFGDYSTNAAMLLAPALGEPPRAIAERLGRSLEDRLAGRVDRVEVAGPGFLNLFLADAWYLQAVDAVLAAGDAYGAGDDPSRPSQRVQIEFVSANPTGPLTAASGRHAAYGDALARILELAGDVVEREYYFNDGGGQVQRLGASIRARARGEAPPEDGYKGDYVAELAELIPDAAGRDVPDVAREAVAILIERIRATLERYRVHFDHWFLEATLYAGDPSPWDRARGTLAEQGRSYQSEGALWLRTTELGDDKDRVLVRSSGEPTYFAADVAYHWDKLDRGFDRLINVLGADHHGYVARLKAAVAAVGADPDRLEVPILQFVHIVEGGARASMSKRRGDFVTLDDLIDEIGVDATRWFMLSRSHESGVDLDLTLAKAQSNENPVYYVQYAHARIASMLRRAGEERVAAALAGSRAGLALEPAERELVRRLLAFPAEVREAAERRAPHRIAAYALDVAQVFTAFYRDCRVVGAEPEALESFRIALSVATQRVIAGALGLLGVSAPESM
jgi:arginyl-tRNA synthetase